jgi:curved DNA-binding protein CbpA
MDLYETLGVGRDATDAELSAAYRKAVKRTHPDAGGDEEAFHAVQKALDVLSDPRARARYDATGHAEEPEPENLLHAQAMSTIASKLTQLVGAQGMDLDTFDLVLGIREMLDGDARTAAATIDTIRAQQERLRTVRRRLKRKEGAEGPDRIAEMLDGQIKGLEPVVEAGERDIRIYAYAKELAAQYVYEYDAPRTVFMGNVYARPAGIFGSSST